MLGKELVCLLLSQGASIRSYSKPLKGMQVLEKELQRFIFLALGMSGCESFLMYATAAAE